MRLSLGFLLVLLFIVSCRNTGNEHTDLTSLIPDNSSYILKINNLTAYSGEIRNNDFLQSLGKANDLDLLSGIDFLEISSPFYLCRNEKKEVLIILNTFQASLREQTGSSVTIDSVALKKGNTLSTNYKGKQWFFKQIGSALVVSNAKHLVDNSAIHSQDHPIKSLLDITNKKASANVFFKEGTNNITNVFPQVNGLFKNWKFFDIIPKSKSMLLSGVTEITEEIPMRVLGNTRPATSETATVVPVNMSRFTSFVFTNSNDLSLTSPIDSTFLESVTEVGFVENNESITSAVVFTPLPESKVEFFAQEQVENYKEIPVYSVDSTSGIDTFFGNFHQNFNPTLVVAHDKYLLFSNSLSDLQEQLDQILNNNTLAHQEYYKKSMSNLPVNSSLLIVSLLNNNAEKWFSDKYSLAIFQGIVSNHNVLLTLLAEETEEDIPVTSTPLVKETGSFLLENDLVTNPQLVIDYVTHSLNIVAQDIQNNLYFMTLEGKILWKLKLDGPVQGNIEQIDIYNNGRLQLAFTTKHNFYILGRNGENAKNFPVTFKDEISNPAGIFDYDLNHDYRFLITQKDALYMIDKNGDRVNGFKLSKTLGNITNTPKHIRVGKKDYILLTTDTGKLYILDRRGQIRVPVSDKLEYSDNDIYWYENTFAGTSKTGDLIKVDENGGISKTTLPLQAKHYITGTKKAWVTFTENLLTINSNVIPLDFGDYTAPKIYSAGKRTYISITDKQTNRIFLFDLKGKPINGFPIFGSGQANIAYDKNSRNILLIVSGKSNQIIVYKM